MRSESACKDMGKDHGSHEEGILIELALTKVGGEPFTAMKLSIAWDLTDREFLSGSGAFS